MREAKTQMFTLDTLPYDHNALEPYLSAKTLAFHHDKHHQAYVNTLNELIAETMYLELTLEEIMIKTVGDKEQSVLFNNAAQVWNHNFYWKSLSPKENKKPTGELRRIIEISFGNYENMIREMVSAGMSQFGSGWAWLVKENGLLRVMKTQNAGNPILEGRGTPLLVIDVWEHAYYLDYQNRRDHYLAEVLDKLISWDFAAENFNKK